MNGGRLGGKSRRRHRQLYIFMRRVRLYIYVNFHPFDGTRLS